MSTFARSPICQGEDLGKVMNVSGIRQTHRAQETLMIPRDAAYSLRLQLLGEVLNLKGLTESFGHITTKVVPGSRVR